MVNGVTAPGTIGSGFFERIAGSAREISHPRSSIHTRLVSSPAKIAADKRQSISQSSRCRYLSLTQTVSPSPVRPAVTSSARSSVCQVSTSGAGPQIVILHQPRVPAPRMILRVSHVHRTIPVRHWMRGIALVGINRVGRAGRWRIERQFAVFAKIKVARLGFPRRPGIKRSPRVAASLKQQRFLQWQLPFVFQPVGKQRRFDFLSKINRRVAAERNRAQRFTRSVSPAAVIPRAGGQKIQVLLVHFLQSLVSCHRPVKNPPGPTNPPRSSSALWTASVRMPPRAASRTRHNSDGSQIRSSSEVCPWKYFALALASGPRRRKKS